VVVALALSVVAAAVRDSVVGEAPGNDSRSRPSLS